MICVCGGELFTLGWIQKYPSISKKSSFAHGRAVSDQAELCEKSDLFHMHLYATAHVVLSHGFSV